MNRTRIPQYAKSPSRFSFRMRGPPSQLQTRRFLDQDLNLFISGGKELKEKSIELSQTEKIKSLELQARTLHRSFSSLDKLEEAKPRLSFVWDEMGLALKPLSEAYPSLYLILTKDQMKTKSKDFLIKDGVKVAAKAKQKVSTGDTTPNTRKRMCQKKQLERRSSCSSSEASYQGSTSSEDYKSASSKWLRVPKLRKLRKKKRRRARAKANKFESSSPSPLSSPAISENASTDLILIEDQHKAMAGFSNDYAAASLTISPPSLPRKDGHSIHFEPTRTSLHGTQADDNGPAFGSTSARERTLRDETNLQSNQQPQQPTKSTTEDRRDKEVCATSTTAETRSRFSLFPQDGHSVHFEPSKTSLHGTQADDNGPAIGPGQRTQRDETNLPSNQQPQQPTEPTTTDRQDIEVCAASTTAETRSRFSIFSQHLKSVFKKKAETEPTPEVTLTTQTAQNSFPTTALATQTAQNDAPTTPITTQTTQNGALRDTLTTQTDQKSTPRGAQTYKTELPSRMPHNTEQLPNTSANLVSFTGTQSDEYSTKPITTIPSAYKDEYKSGLAARTQTEIKDAQSRSETPETPKGRSQDKNSAKQGGLENEIKTIQPSQTPRETLGTPSTSAQHYEKPRAITESVGGDDLKSTQLSGKTAYIEDAATRPAISGVFKERAIDKDSTKPVSDKGEFRSLQSSQTSSDTDDLLSTSVAYGSFKVKQQDTDFVKSAADKYQVERSETPSRTPPYISVPPSPLQGVRPSKDRDQDRYSEKTRANTASTDRDDLQFAHLSRTPSDTEDILSQPATPKSSKYITEGKYIAKSSADGEKLISESASRVPSNSEFKSLQPSRASSDTGDLPNSPLMYGSSKIKQKGKDSVKLEPGRDGLKSTPKSSETAGTPRTLVKNSAKKAIKDSVDGEDFKSLPPSRTPSYIADTPGKAETHGSVKERKQSGYSEKPREIRASIETDNFKSIPPSRTASDSETHGSVKERKQGGYSEKPRETRTSIETDDFKSIPPSRIASDSADSPTRSSRYGFSKQTQLSKDPIKTVADKDEFRSLLPSRTASYSADLPTTTATYGSSKERPHSRQSEKPKAKAKLMGGFMTSVRRTLGGVFSRGNRDDDDGLSGSDDDVYDTAEELLDSENDGSFISA